MSAKFDIQKVMQRISHGAVDMIEDKSIQQRLEKAHKNNKPLRIKLGLDPSSPDLHLGHTVVLNKLRDFQLAGHTAVLVIGDFTARIGDPSGRNKLRPPLSLEEIDKNAKTYTDQAFKILDPDKTDVVFNGTWLGKLTPAELIQMCARTSVAQILERDDFSKRYKSNIPIFLHEFLYPLFQAYDSVELKNDIELGGTDQTFNLLMGRSLQRAFNIVPQDILTTPILEGLDGTHKMSKSLGNTIALNDTPVDMFGKIMSLSDTLMLRYFDLLSFKPLSEIESLKKRLASGKKHPMKAKEELAYEITERFHGKSAADQSQTQFNEVHRSGGLPDEIAMVKFEEPALPLVQLVVRCGLTKSMKESRRKILEGAVSIDGEKIKDPNQLIQTNDAEHILRLGKRHFKKFTQG